MTGATTQVWLVDLDQAAVALDARELAQPSLSPTDHQRLAGMSDPVAQRLRRTTYIAQRLVLIHVFSPELRLAELPRDALGRPHLPTGSSGSISLAHTGTHALIAASHSPRIGVDLEAPRTIRMSPARRALIQAAAQTLSADPLPTSSDARFLQAWTRLEALAKADGHGIGHVLTRIGAVGGGQPYPEAAAALAASNALTLHDLAVGPSLFAALATTGKEKPALHHWPAGLPI